MESILKKELGTVIDMIRTFANARGPIRLTLSVAASAGTKTEKGTITGPLEPRVNPVGVAGPRKTQSLMPATIKEASDILSPRLRGPGARVQII
jgi:hypothetical protein